MDELMDTTVRGCGRRVKGGVYAETKLSPTGVALEAFLVDPPIAVDLLAAGIASRGVQLLQVKGVWHLVDVVGSKFYPHPSDFLEEARLKGVSRRLPANLDFSKLTRESRLVLLHRRAVIQNFGEYPQPPELVCPKELGEHGLTPLRSMCAGLWWRDFSPEELNSLGQRLFAGGVLYHAEARPQGVAPLYQAGAFVILPISNLAVVDGAPESQERFERAKRAELPVEKVAA
jgi:hypothetical protein